MRPENFALEKIQYIKEMLTFAYIIPLRAQQSLAPCFSAIQHRKCVAKLLPKEVTPNSTAQAYIIVLS